MEDSRPVEDYRSPEAAKLADAGAGVITVGRWLFAAAEREESAYRRRERERADESRRQAAERQRRHRHNQRVIAQQESAPLLEQKSA